MIISPIPIMAKYYSLLPLAQGKFAEDNLGLIDRAVFGMIYDRWRLSSYHVLGSCEESRWYDYEMQEIYCVFAHDELARLLGVSEKTVRRSLQLLKTKRYLWWTKKEYKGANHYYITRTLQEYMSSLRKDSKEVSNSP